MRTENIYSVYVHKNLKNEKYYVGCTKRNPKRRWNNGWGYQNNSQMWKDIQESNWNTDWVHGILGKFENEQDALKYESFLIAMLDSVNNGYNLSTFSHFGFTEKTKNKMSKSHTGDKNHMYGKHHSEETKKKMSKAKTGEKHPNFGKHLSEEHRKKMSEAHGVYGILQYSKTGEFIEIGRAS